MWLNNWHPYGILFDKYGFKIVYDSQSCLNAKLDSVLKNGMWCWRPARSEALVDIQSRLPDVKFEVANRPIWIISKNGSYVSVDTWDYLRQKKSLVSWWSLVWFPQAILKQAFLLWLLFKIV